MSGKLNQHGSWVWDFVDSPAYAGSIVQVRGQALAEALETAIGGRDRAAIIASMAAAAGISRLQQLSRFYGVKATCLLERDWLASLRR